MKKMARAMGVENPSSGKDFIAALDKRIDHFTVSFKTGIDIQR